ncbi:hypothetical protein GCM10010912_54610 [Paenibacillus albidus]|uniref:Cell envelope-related transcriptional attenuator domain-containing protein n=1 Tax=Paenibacillus albidus TaxID=2041023 RepID=A0A917FU24_9BACL|nr:LCP family protein [Paenibacillus albidus]GGG02924.1 hypothetical protein GCM10010912_54610 [Paenibacillus albidus]
MQEKKRKNRVQKIVWTLGIALGACLVTVGIYASVLYYKTNQALEKITASAQPTPVATQGPPEIAPEPADIPATSVLGEDKPITFLLSGIDYRAGSGGTLNTDVMMVAVYNPVSRKASLLSIPRDMKITSDDIGTHKANYYYAYYFNHNREEDLSRTKQFFGKILQMDIDYMVLINFDAFRSIIDELGGLMIDVPMDMRYVDNADGTNIDLSKGLQLLDGKEVLDYVRYRKSNRGTAESSDFSRNERQQEVLDLMLGKLDSLNGITQWADIIDILGDNIRTDIDKPQLLKWVMNYKSIKPASTELITVASEWKSPYVYADKDDLLAKLEQLRAPLNLAPLKKNTLLQHFGIAE